MMAGQIEIVHAEESFGRRRHGHWHDRLMALTDGVFGFAITLLAADIVSPTQRGASLAALWRALAAQLDVFALSFVVISVFWLAHRRFMALIRAVDPPVTVMTLGTLGLIALLPAITRLTHAQFGSPASMTIYATLVVAIGVSLALMWAYAAFIGKLVFAEVSGAVRWLYLALMLYTPPAFLALTIIIPHPVPGEVPAALAALFVIGWRMRVWAVRRLGGTP